MWSERVLPVGLSTVAVLGLLMAGCASTPQPTTLPTYTPYPTHNYHIWALSQCRF